MEGPIYVGSGKEHRFLDGGSSISVSLDLNGMSQLFRQYGFTTQNGRKIIKLKISQRRQVGQYGETHTVTVDTWKPDQQNQGYQQQPQQQQNYQQQPQQGQQPQNNFAAPQQNGQPQRFEDDIPF